MPSVTPDLSESSANTINIKTYDASLGRHIIDQIVCSYNATPTNGRLYIEDGGTIIFDVDITAAGPAPIPMEMMPLVGGESSQMRIIMAAGGANVISKMNIFHRLG